MAVTICYDTEFLRTVARQLRQASYEHADAIDKICNLVHGLPDIWQGNAERNFVNNFELLAEMFKQFDQTLESYAGQLENWATKMEEADRLCQKKIQSSC